MAGKSSMKAGMVWTAVQNFGNMGVSFVSNIILARLLLPSEYGTIGILMVFIAFSQIFVDGGFASALIQKKDVSNSDFNSVFLFNITISTIFYIALFSLAPLIADFFNDGNLIKTLRVIGLVLITNSFSLIQVTQLQKGLQFKKLSFYNLISIICGTMLAIIMALCGCGVWSLVFKTLATSVVLCLILWSNTFWKPTMEFHFQKIRNLFNFGGFIFLSTLIEFVYAYMQPVLIGKFFSMSDLGFFTQSKKIEEIPAGSLLAVVTSVMFPVFSKLNDDTEKLVEKARKSLKLVSFLSFPIMTWMMVSATDVVLILLGDKWITAAPFLSILCIAGMFRVPSGSNMCIIKSIGKSSVFMYVQLLKRVLGIICIIISLKWGLMGLMWGFSISNVLFYRVFSLMFRKTSFQSTEFHIKTRA